MDFERLKKAHPGGDFDQVRIKDITVSMLDAVAGNFDGKKPVTAEDMATLLTAVTWLLALMINGSTSTVTDALSIVRRAGEALEQMAREGYGR